MIDDIIPFEQFVLKWRFADPAYNVLPPEVLARIRPMGTRASRDTYERVRPIVKSFTFNRTLYPNVEIHKFDNIEHSGETCRWLKQHLLNELSEDVAISWGPDMAVTARVEDFCNYWDDFCYPGTDDVIVLPSSAEWALYHGHEGQFILGRRAL